MSLRLYMDVDVRHQITVGLRRRAVDVLTAQDDGAGRFPDPLLLDRATALGRVLFTQDEDLLAEAAARQARGRSFASIIYAHQLQVTIGACIEDLELIAVVFEPQEIVDQLVYLPLK